MPTNYIDVDTDLENLFVRRDYLSNGNLYTCGYNLYGQLGTDNTTNRSSPGTVAGGGTNWKQVASGELYAIAIKTDGTLWAWGHNAGGQLGIGTISSRSSPVTTAGGGTNWKQVSAGYLSSAAIKTDGTLWTWGANSFGQLGTGNTTNRSSPGTTAGGGTDWKFVSSGNDQTIAMKTDGTLWAWGLNDIGQLGDGTNTNRSSPRTVAGGNTDWKEISAGYSSSAAIKTDGTLWTWGGNFYGELGDGTTTSRSSPGTVAGGGNNWRAISSGSFSMMAIKTDGTLWTWGLNDTGQLGTNNTTNRSSPGTVAGGGTNWKQVSAGSGSSAAIKTDGTLWTWGANSLGQLGTGNTTNRSSPVTVAGGASILYKSVTIALSTYAIQDISL